MKVERGTLQGDTLSPFLFLIYMEPLLRWLNVGGRGHTFGCVPSDKRNETKCNSGRLAWPDAEVCHVLSQEAGMGSACFFFESRICMCSQRRLAQALKGSWHKLSKEAGTGLAWHGPWDGTHQLSHQPLVAEPQGVMSGFMGELAWASGGVPL
jgi:hypothetical protein